MRVLITGIDGFVGSHMAEYLLDANADEIHGTVLDAGGGRNIAHLRGRLRLHQVDITDIRAVSTLFEEVRPDRVIHLAGQAFVPESLLDPTRTYQTNVIGSVSVLDAARRQRASVGQGPALLLVSSGEVYGRVMPDRTITEDLPLSPANPYAASKACIELIAREYKSTFDVHVTVVRPFNHAGPRQSPNFVCSDFGKQFAEIAVGKRAPVLSVGNIQAERDFTDVRDVVRAYWLLFDRASPEYIFNVCSGRSVQIRELLTLLNQISGLTIEILPKEERLRSYDLPRVVGSYDRLHQATGWEPRIPLTQTLQDVFTYWSIDVRSAQQEPSNSP